MNEHITFSDTVTRIWELTAAGLLSVLGGSAAYTYDAVKRQTGFQFKSFLVNAFLAFFIGNLVGGFIPHDAEFRDGLLMLAGFSTWPLLACLEILGKKLISDYLFMRVGLNPPTEDQTTQQGQLDQGEQQLHDLDIQIRIAEARQKLSELEAIEKSNQP